ncbi:hypothetical protein B0J12DRAFT_337957 [Macrophomina phaseolina]|uniref:Uncharacterized protein n=1 Tax=Macrophomina phaseolina TaxID=35725 RepID=A0ABQ8GPQ0_9PEZI|nr:hypothetical protein B0J12DRAFT_337957 [Macrophomina phaseolina]
MPCGCPNPVHPAWKEREVGGLWVCVRACGFTRSRLPDGKGSSPPLALMLEPHFSQPSGSPPPRRNGTSPSRVANRPGTRAQAVAHLLLSFYIIVAPLRDHDDRTTVAPKHLVRIHRHGPFHAVISSIWNWQAGVQGRRHSACSDRRPSDPHTRQPSFFTCRFHPSGPQAMRCVISPWSELSWVTLRFEAKVF